MKRTTLDTEAGVQAEIRRMLSAKGWRSQKIPGSALLKGFPDLYCVHRESGRIIHIEVKAPKVRLLRWSQVKWFEQFASHQGFYVVNDPSKLWPTVNGPSNWHAWVPKDKRLEQVVEEWAEEG